jgi:hypothetical protein
VGALVRLAASRDYRDRADAGRALASFAEMPGARESLLGLVLDADDTFVTRATAEALLRRQDTAGLAIVAEALVTADFQRFSWIHTAVVDVFGIFVADRDGAVRTCEALGLDTNEQVRQGAGELLDMLNQISPILYPQPDH